MSEARLEVIPEALLQFDRETDKPYVEVATGDQQFERRDIEIGISDGVNVEITSGLTMEDKVKNVTVKVEESTGRVNFTDGKSKKQIADLMNVSFHTIDTHLKNIYSKLHVHPQIELISKVFKEKLI